MKARVTFFLPVLLALVLAGVATTTRGQSSLDGFDPSMGGQVYAIVAQPDGKILIGGFFDRVQGVTRNFIARVNRDGTLDSAFNANAPFVGNALVLAIAVQPDGKILVGGGFHGTNSMGGQTRNYIARLDPVTGAADSFNPNANQPVSAIVVLPDGRLLVGGPFTTIGGQERHYIARLDPVTGQADSFNPNAVVGSNRYVDAIAIQRDGKILVGGPLHGIGGEVRNHLARLDPVTGLADSFNPNPDSQVTSIALQADGKILVGGGFGLIGGQMRNFIARLDPISGLADSFNPNANNPVHALMVQPDGKILVGGGFFGPYSIGGQGRWLVARLDPTTGLADSFDPNVYQVQCCQPPNVRAFAVQPDGKVLMGGDFFSLAPNKERIVVRHGIARLEADGRADQTLNIKAIGEKILATAAQVDGKMLIGGSFSNVLAMPRNNIARFNSDGTLDMDFNPNANSEVDAIAVQPDGKILIGGHFQGENSVGGQKRNYIARLDPVTGASDFFNPDANAPIEAIALQSDGRILVSGQFNGPNSIGGETRNYVARLDRITGLADSFDPNADGVIHSLALQNDGKIIVAGAYSNIGGKMRNNIARLDPATALADSFDPNADGEVLSILVQSDGKILAGGNFTSIGGQTRKHIARLDSTTGTADSFVPNANGAVISLAAQADGKIIAAGDFNRIGASPRYLVRLDGETGQADVYDARANDAVHSIALAADGKILIAGEFTSIDGQVRNLFARLTNDTPALQDLSATARTITWSRGGTSVQFSRVTFEYSAENANYSLLGNGGYAGNAWMLSGLSLPPHGQNFYIRARGFYRTGQNNGSESIAESVRNVFLHAVNVTNMVSRKVHGAAGPFDININLSQIGNHGVECRSGGATGDYQLVFSFANPIISVGDASVTNGIGSVSSRMIDTDAHNYIVNLTGVSNAQQLTIALTNVNDDAGNSSASVSAFMGVLIGDVNGNGAVNGSDVAQAKTNSGQAVDGSNFRSDVNANGSINASDVALVKANSGTGVSSQASFSRKTF